MFSMIWLAALGVVLSAMVGCGVETSLDSPDSSARIRAIQRAAASGDSESVPKLINLLGSDDPAVRLLSIRTLERMHGQTFGYDHSAPEAERAEAIERWVIWQRSLATHGEAAAAPPSVRHGTDRASPTNMAR